MYILIAGGGIVGRGMAKTLSKNHDVVIIDPSYDNCEKISSKIGAVAIQGDATKIATLREAGIEKCDVAVGVMGEDSLNLLFALLSKNHGVKEIFVRMRDPEYREAYELAGATNIGHMVQMMVNKFVLDIENPEIRRVASLSNGKAEICIVTLEEHSKVAGKPIKEIATDKHFPNEVVIAGVFDMESDRFIVPRGSTEIQLNQQIFLVGPREAIKKAYKSLIG
jgi:trk system potassium uptake protein TrkA